MDAAAPMNILLLEDDADDAELILHFLHRQQLVAKARRVDTCEEFLLALEEDWDVILADYTLPAFSPLEALQLLREAQREIPVLLVSGTVREERAVECLREGAADYLLKDRLARLPQAMRRAVEAQRLRNEEHRAREQLRRNERRFRALAENGAEAVAMARAEGTVVYFAGPRLLGRPSQDYLGENLFHFAHPQDRADAWSQFASLLGRPNGTVTLQFRGLHQDGSWVWLEATAANRLQDADLEALVVSFRDIRRHIEIEDALRASEEQSRLLVEAVRDYAIVMLDSGGRVASWNVGAERIQGYRAEEIVGRHFSCFYAEEDLREGLPSSLLQQAVEAGRCDHEGWRVRKDGTRFWAHTVITAVRDGAGRLRGFSKVSQDVTERMQAHLDLQQSNAELQRSNAELQEFAYVASHDLQEPLRKIRAFGDLLRTKCADALGDAGRDYLQRMQAAAARMTVLINDLLTFSRVGTQPRPHREVDLGEVVRDALSDLEALLEETGGRVEVGPLPTVEADRTQMRQLFQNLLGNALKFHQDQVPPRVHVFSPPQECAPCADGRLVEVHVEDNGIGFEERYAERIFTIFQRLHERGRYDGTGVGLAVCRKIVARHGGTIVARSEPGEGALFIVRLPVHARPGADSSDHEHLT